MSVFEIILIIFTAAMAVASFTLCGLLALTNLFGINYETSGRVSFVASFLGVVAALALSGSAIATVCTWMSGISLVIVAAFLVSLLVRASKNR